MAEKVTEYCHEFVHQLMMYFFGEKIRSLALAKTKNKDKHSFILRFKGKQDLAMVLVMEKVMDFLECHPLSVFVNECEKWFAVPSPLMYDINKSFEVGREKIFPFKFPTPGMYLHPLPFCFRDSATDTILFVYLQEGHRNFWCKNRGMSPRAASAESDSQAAGFSRQVVYDNMYQQAGKVVNTIKKKVRKKKATYFKMEYKYSKDLITLHLFEAYFSKYVNDITPMIVSAPLVPTPFFKNEVKQFEINGHIVPWICMYMTHTLQNYHISHTPIVFTLVSLFVLV